MALKERPQNWHLFAVIPEPNDRQTAIRQEWQLSFEAPVSYDGQEFTFDGPLRVASCTRNAAVGVELLIKLDGKVKTFCARCLSPLTVAICEDFLYCYVLQSVGGEKDDEDEDCESKVIYLSVNQLKSPVDISDLVWECIIVSLPVFAVCPEGCAVLQPSLSQEERIDPRFDILAEFLSKNKEGGK